MIRHKQLLGALLMLLGWLPLGSQAEWVQAEGMAALSAGNATARAAAIQDALSQAGLTNAAQVHAADTISQPPVPGSTLTVRPAAAPKQYAILREWQSDGLYHVLLRAHVDSRQAIPATALKKTVAVARFYFAHPQQGDDVADLDTGMTQEIARRLERSGRYLIRVTDTMPFPIKDTEFTHDPDGTVNPERVKAIARDTASQFVVTGRILDAGATQDLTPFLGHTSSLNAGQGALLPLPFSDFAVGLARQPRHRRLEVELLVYDGLSGARVSRHRLTADVSGAVSVGRAKPFGSDAFYKTRYGAAADQLLRGLAQSAERDMAGLPFMAKIVRIDQGRAIIDSGTIAGICPGDKLTVYRQGGDAPVLGLNNEILGAVEHPAATLVIDQVQPRFAVGLLSPDNNDVQPGDIVRAGS